MNFNSAISDRTLGQYAISIPTSLSLEGLFGVYPERPETPAPIDKLQINNIWINVFTLVRNMVNSLHKEAALLVLPDELAPAILEEMEIISQVLAEHSNFKMKITYYVSQYKGLEKYSLAQLRIPHTDLQKTTHSIINQTIEMVIKDSKNTNHPVHVDKLKLEPAQHQPRTLILTHVAYDLLSAREFQELLLLESHTGVIKDKTKWYTRYYNGKDLVRIPFNLCFLQIFGDNTLFKPWSYKVRNQIIELANEYNWTFMTTKDKIKSNIENLKDHYLREVINNMLNDD